MPHRHYSLILSRYQKSRTSLLMIRSHALPTSRPSGIGRPGGRRTRGRYHISETIPILIFIDFCSFYTFPHGYLLCAIRSTPTHASISGFNNPSRPLVKDLSILALPGNPTRRLKRKW